MTSLRQNKASRLIQKELSIIFQREAKALFGGALVSVTLVRVSPDLKSAKVYVSFFGKSDKDEMKEKLQNLRVDMRRRLGLSVKNQLRSIPELFFFLDDSIDYEIEISELLNKGKDKK